MRADPFGPAPSELVLEEDALRGTDVCDDDDGALGACALLLDDEEDDGLPRVLPVVEALLPVPLPLVRTDPLALVPEFLRDRTLPFEFTDVVLRPRLALGAPTTRDGRPVTDELVAQVHERAHKHCFIARSVNFPVVVDPVPLERELAARA